MLFLVLRLELLQCNTKEHIRMYVLLQLLLICGSISIPPTHSYPLFRCCSEIQKAMQQYQRMSYGHELIKKYPIKNSHSFF